MRLRIGLATEMRVPKTVRQARTIAKAEPETLKMFKAAVAGDEVAVKNLADKLVDTAGYLRAQALKIHSLVKQKNMKDASRVIDDLGAEIYDMY